MTPKEKAENLVESFMLWKFQRCELSKKQAKKCALIAVDELLFTLNEISEEDENTYAYHTAIFYNEVKTELKKI